MHMQPDPTKKGMIDRRYDRFSLERACVACQPDSSALVIAGAEALGGNKLLSERIVNMVV